MLIRCINRYFWMDHLKQKFNFKIFELPIVCSERTKSPEFWPIIYFLFKFRTNLSDITFCPLLFS